MEYSIYNEPATFEQALEDRDNWKRRCTELASETTAYVDKLVAEKRTLEAIADARMTRIEELEAAIETIHDARLEWAMVCPCPCMACDKFYEAVRDSAPETIAEPDKCANCGHSVQAHAADSGHCSCGQCSGFIPFAVNRAVKP